MALDRDLLAAENDARGARADCHRAVGRLHLAVAPLREVAKALGISHQGVQQIVQATGGTWWTRVWRTRCVGPDMACSFCGRLSEHVAKLIAGPEVFICDACVALAEQVQQTRKPKGTARARIEPDGSPTVRCSFCGRKGSESPLVGTTENTVCRDCLELCRHILEGTSPAGEPATPTT